MLTVLYLTTMFRNFFKFICFFISAINFKVVHKKQLTKSYAKIRLLSFAKPEPIIFVFVLLQILKYISY